MRSRPWPPAVQQRLADVAVIGGSGFYSMGGDVAVRSVDTPYGPPSGDVTITEISGRRVAFLPRHGAEHTIPAHRVNYRANLWAMHSLGAQALIAPCSVGSLSADIAPGHMVVLDDIIDRTRGRNDTYFDGDDGVVNHVTFARPYDASLRRLAASACEAEGVVVHSSGTVVVINMTQYPEAVLAAELALPYCGIALVTDYDAGIEGVEERPVTMEQVLAVMHDNVDAFHRVLRTWIGAWIPPADS
jgi:5'-methylthioadenosine phosphorylase